VRLRLLGLASALALWASAACFSERTAGPGAAGECRVPVSVIDSMHVVVAIRNFLYYPDSIAVPPGATVTWINCEPPGTQAHSTTSDTPAWDSGLFTSDGRFSRTFPAGGTFPYHCSLHPYMVAKVVVQ